MPLDTDLMIPLVEDRYPLTPLQQGMLFHSLDIPSFYLQQYLCRLEEPLDLDCFQAAWQRILERYSILRTCFQWQDTEIAQQIVYKHLQCPWHFEDWRHLNTEQQQQQLQEYLYADRQRGFALDQAPLMRVAVFQWSETDYGFIWSNHHSILDGRSRLLLFRELFTHYETLRQHHDAELGPAYPYRDYVDWLKQQDFTQAETFWRQQLQGLEAPTPLIDLQATPEQAQVHAQQELFLSQTLTQALQNLTQSLQITLNTVIQGLWALLLSRYARESTVAFGATRACRYWTTQDPQYRIGLFINTVPMCVAVPTEMPAAEWLQQLRQHWVAMRDYEHTPLALIQKWSPLGAQQALFDSIVVFEGYDLNTTLQAQGGEWLKRSFQLYQQIHYPLVFSVTQMQEGLRFTLEYDAQRFGSDVITRMLGHLRTLAEGLVQQPQQCLGQLPLLTALERQQLLKEWNHTELDYPHHQCVHQLFEAQVEKTPQAIALTFEGQQLSYRQLNGRANQLAHQLRALGVQADTCVGLYLQRGLEMLIGLLGIFKAGGAYVPLDPMFPPERLSFMLADADVKILVTQATLQETLSNYHGQYIDVQDEKLLSYPETNLTPGAQTHHLAYVIYTSGSTGQPKGVQIEHRSLTNFLYAFQERLQLSPADKLLAVTTISFDIATLELYLPLLVGAHIHLVNREVAADGAHLLTLLDDITVMQATPATWRLLLAAGWQHTPQLTTLVGGEAVAGQLAESLRVRSAQAWNVYGPTETTVWSTAYPITAAMNHEAVSVPIGKPIANTQVYVLDPQLQPVPIGVAGELYIGGDGVARGYLNRLQLTEEKFITAPFEASKQLYKTGDLVRYLPRGDLEFLGRLDHQVKIRGFRIELGEIEALLLQVPEVREAVVIVREDEPGHQRLVAYVVMDSELQPQVLRTALRTQLPDYMIPAQFVQLPQMPLTPNGKINRRALPVPTISTSSETKTDAVNAPLDQLEQQLVLIWQQVLATAPIKRDDNFFELGGHSLLAITLLNRIEKILGKTLPLATLFQYPTIEQLAQVLRQSETPLSSSPWIVLQAGDGRKPPLFLIQVLGQGLKYGLALARHLGPEQTLYGLSTGLLEYEQAQAIKSKGSKTYYAELIRSLQPQGPYLLVGVHCGGRTAFEVAQQLYQQGQSVAFLALMDTRVVVRGKVASQQAPVHKRIKLHGYLFSQNKSAYLRQMPHRIHRKTYRQYQHWKRQYYRLMCWLYLKGKRPLADKFQEFLFEEAARTEFNYRPQPYPGRLTLFRAREQKLFNDPEPGWRNVAAGGLEVHDIPGTHITMWHESNVHTLAQELKTCIEKALE